MSAPSEPVVLGQGRFLRLARVGRWEYAERINSSGAIAVIAVTPAGNLLLVEQFRIPCNRPVIELPAGIVGDEPENAHEKILEAAKRELLEETGYEAGELAEILTGPTSAGLSSEQVTLCLARSLRRIHDGGGHAGEQITVHEVPLPAADSWVLEKTKAGKLVDPKVFAGIFFAQRENV